MSIVSADRKPVPILIENKNKTYRCYEEVHPDGYPERYKELSLQERQWTIPNSTYYYDVARYTHPIVLAQPAWADEETPSQERKQEILDSLFPVWNSHTNVLDFHKISQICYIDEDGLPLNPLGRTGLSGRGLLGKWGPNLAGDLILARKKDGANYYVTQVRKDSYQLSTTGGMVDPSDILEHKNNKTKMINGLINAALREYIEEASNDNTAVLDELKEYIKSHIQCISGGICDDVRNTDKAFMATGVFLVFLPEELADKLQLQNDNDEASKITWRTLEQINGFFNGIFASHKEYFIKAEQVLKAKMSPKRTVDSMDVDPDVATRTLFVANILAPTTDVEVGNYFAKFGNVSAVKFLPKKSDTMCAFVDFEKVEDARKAFFESHEYYTVHFHKRRIELASARSTKFARH